MTLYGKNKTNDTDLYAQYTFCTTVWNPELYRVMSMEEYDSEMINGKFLSYELGGKMLTTDELERKIKKCIAEVLPNITLTQINFSVGTDTSPEGTYIYAQNDKYHVVFTEKGKIRTHKELDTEEETLWNVLDVILFDIAMEYAIRNQVQGQDFRRILFTKEIELYSQFGDNYKTRKIKEINEILQKNPYYDK